MNLLESTIGRRLRRQPAARDRFGAKMAEAFEHGRQQGRREVIHGDGPGGRHRLNCPMH